MPFLSCLNRNKNDTQEDDDDVEVFDAQAKYLSYVGKAAYEILRTEHGSQHHSLWNVTTGGIIGPVHLTPVHDYDGDDDDNNNDNNNTTENNKTRMTPYKDPEPNSSDWFACKVGEILSKTEIWADIMSLGPPDGLFMEQFQLALCTIAQRAKNNNDTKVTVRMMFGNIIGMPLDCNALIKELTNTIPSECQPNIRLWVGAWRKGVSWNHAKIIAVDGIYLHTGGHNLWDYHYLKDSPVYDLSMEVNGPVVHDGHLFANDQWEFIEKVQATCCGEIADKIPDSWPLLAQTRVAVSEFPKGQTTEFPPQYKRRIVTKKVKEQIQENEINQQQLVPMISMGRYGSILRYYRPADDAFVAMFNAAKKTIRMALQDLGPVCIPQTKISLPGCVWPKEYLIVFAKAIMRGVDVEIILSNPNSIPGGLSATEANYGNGWSCVDVAAEIVKTIQKEFPNTNDETLRSKVQNNLRICFIRRSVLKKQKYVTDMTIGLHSKHFIIDDRTCYIGSQNLYICDLAEWGLVIDHEISVKKIMKECWTPLWKTSFDGTDVNVNDVMDGLKINRDGDKPSLSSAWQYQQDAALRQMGGHSSIRHIAN